MSSRKQSESKLRLIEVTLDVFLALSIGFYVNLVTQRDDLRTALLSGHILSFISSSGRLNFLLFCAVSIVVARQRLARRWSALSRKDVITKLLEAAAKALVLPRSVERVPIRAFCHLADLKTKKLVPFCTWSLYPYPHYDALIPFEGRESEVFVISRAFQKGSVLAEELPANHIDLTPPDLRDKMWKNIRCVLAAPIRQFDISGSEVLGTISFDSSHPLTSLGFDKPQAEQICILYASSIFELLRKP